MKRKLEKSQKTLGVPSLQSRLTSYALVAGAAGVSALALAARSEAEVVYTPADVKIRAVENVGFGYALDLNGDGIADFQLVNDTFGNGGGQSVVPAVHGNRIEGVGSYASALRPGASIGPTSPFARQAGRTRMAAWIRSSGITSSSGPWKNAQNLYLGCKFLIDGQYHFGWARISIHLGDMLLTGYAYETIANKPVKAGQQTGSDEAASIPATRRGAVNAGATLGSLALGSAGLVAWRKQKS